MIAFDYQHFLTHCPQDPGVYLMLDAQQQVLYVGKAKHLKNRVTQYFKGTKTQHKKTQALVKKIADIQVTTTETEWQALLLEAQLIKQHQPPYNILLKDDKTFSALLFTTHGYPQIKKTRLNWLQKHNQPYFGPYAQGKTAEHLYDWLQKAFQLRTCEDSVFAHRTRPCLLHQIERCSAPCVAAISQDAYQQQVLAAQAVLKGDTQAIQQDWQSKMMAEAAAEDFEQAANWRDKLKLLSQLSEAANPSMNRDVTWVMGWAIGDEQLIVYRLIVQAQQIQAREHWTFQCPRAETLDMPNVLLQLMAQQARSADTAWPQSLLIPELPEEGGSLLQQALTQMLPNRIVLKTPKDKLRRDWVEQANSNAKTQLQQRLSVHHRYQKQWTHLKQWLELPELSCLLCFDNSHTFGQAMVGASVLFDTSGEQKSAHRAWMQPQHNADDYGTLFESVQKWTTHHIKHGKRLDLLVIDGGKGQLNAARDAIEPIQPMTPLLAMAKGPTRQAGRETLFFQRHAADEIQEVHCDISTPAFYLLQKIRDTAHRYAIKQHRQRRQKQLHQSVLESIPGVGAVKRQQLLVHFGGLQGLKKATQAQLQAVPGISETLAARIWDYWQINK